MHGLLNAEGRAAARPRVSGEDAIQHQLPRASSASARLVIAVRTASAPASTPVPDQLGEMFRRHPVIPVFYGLFSTALAAFAVALEARAGTIATLLLRSRQRIAAL